jgi:hypothetical protein
MTGLAGYKYHLDQMREIYLRLLRLNNQRHLFVDLPAERLQVFGRSAGAL